MKPHRSKFIQIIIGCKLALVLTIFAVREKWIYFGEGVTVAQEKKSDEQPASDASKEAAEEKPKSDGDRKSFLSDLLDLPKLDSSKAKKEDIGKFLNLAERKQTQIDQRITLLEKREQKLKALEKSIDEKLLKIDEERKYFSQTIQKEKDLKGERLEKLITLYEKMEPKKASPLFEKMDRDLVVELFKRLKQKQVTLILEGMSPDKSVELSEYFGRVRSGREYDVLKELNTSLRQEFVDCKGMPASANIKDTSVPEKTNPQSVNTAEKSPTQP
jgi:flagellar motility protein MotE (MotC chaperone)